MSDSRDHTSKRELLHAARRLLAIKDSKNEMLSFMKLTMPDPNAPDDVTQSLYTVTPQARLLCEILERVEKGDLKRVAVSISPQTGKSQILTRGGPAWISGRNPRAHIMVGAYNQDFANEFGDDVRQLINSPAYSQVFPDYQLDKGGQSKDLLITKERGKMAFVGVGGSGTGKPADFFFVDDPIRNDEDANSPTYRDKIWKWFNRVVFTRCHGKTPIVVVHCLTGDTPVLMADGTERELRHIRRGDSVATWDDGELSTSSVLNWKSNGLDNVFTIKTASGISLKANARHPFLVSVNGVPKWIRVRDLRRGYEIFRVNGVSGRAKLASSKDAKNPFQRGDIAFRTTTRCGGQTGFAHHLQALLTPTIRILRTATESLLRITNGFLRSRTASAPSAIALTLAHQGAGAGNSYLTTATTPGSFGRFFVTPATWLSDTLILRETRKRLPTISDFTTDQIIEITPAGVEEVFDIQIDRTENFISGLCVSHNTRWSDDDLIGRLCDPNHPGRNRPVSDGGYAGIEANWKYYNIPAVVTDSQLAAALKLDLHVPTDPIVVREFGSRPMASLWEEKFPLTFLAEAKHNDPVGFSALRMGNPSPEDGSYFRTEDIIEYDMADLPKNLRKYGASDHAVSTKQGRDYTVLGCVGVDENDDLWVLPDLVWDRLETDRTVEEMLAQFQLHKPLLWWMESELISKSFGPFLYKRMREEKVYTSIDAVTPSKDKSLRARSIQGRMRMRKVRFPRRAHWWPAARAQLLRFPAGANDDFVDWLAHIGMGMNKEIKAVVRSIAPRKYKSGSIQWILNAAQAKKRDGVRLKVRGW